MTDIKGMDPAEWQRCLRYPGVPGAVSQWEGCPSNEATGHFDRQPSYEYRPLYTADQVKELTDALAEARKVIEPFVLAHQEWMDHYDDDTRAAIYEPVTFGQIRAASRWLQANKGDGETSKTWEERHGWDERG